jgi:hypothetical protein
MTINKSQGHTFSSVHVYLHRPVFTHDQLYVAVSPVMSKNGLKMLIEDDDGAYTNETKNVYTRKSFPGFHRLIPIRSMYKYIAYIDICTLICI